jgi:anti-anti-sigma factor
MGMPPDDRDAPGCLLIFAIASQHSARVSLTNELDLTVVGCLTEWVHKFTVGPVQAVRLDISGLSFADVAGTRALAQVCHLLRERCSSFGLTGVPPAVQRVTNLAGIDLPGDCDHEGWHD